MNTDENSSADESVLFRLMQVSNSTITSVDSDDAATTADKPMVKALKFFGYYVKILEYPMMKQLNILILLKTFIFRELSTWLMYHITYFGETRKFFIYVR